ncbi:MULTISPECIES: SpoIIE family protein phosphatase [unclassified Streptomyces]|uniref:SpoIIE family protein phosphatase n=1 Tax=unclassified Streptomyces TaxID=2593676 RepID=UPI00382166EF
MPVHDPMDDGQSAAGAAMAAVGTDGVVTGWTPGAARLLGYRRDEVVGQQARTLLAGQLPGSALRSLRHQEEWRGWLRLRHRRGHDVGAKVEAAPMGGGWAVRAEEPGTPLAEWALDQMPAVFGVYDHEKRLIGSSAEGRRVMGVPEQEVIGLRVVEFSPGRRSEKLEELMDRVMESGERMTAETFTQAPGESRAHAWSVYLYPLKDPDGQVRGVSVAALDTTSQYKARKRLSLVNTTSVRIGTTLDVVRTAEELTEVVLGQFADFASVDLLDAVLDEAADDGGPRAPGPVVLRRAAQSSVLAGAPETSVRPGEPDRYPEESPMVRALVTGKASHLWFEDQDVQDWLRTDPLHARTAHAFGVHSLIVVPLRARGTTLGIAQFVRHRTPDPFDPDDLILAEEITARAALSIDNALRYTRERNTALTLQRSMLPQRTPRQAAVTVASRYLPADARVGVGGDWFDVIPLSGTRVALVVGDVVGYGIQASATMGRLRTAVRTLADVDMPPDELLTHLDDLVLRLNREEHPDGPGEHAEHAQHADAGNIGATCVYAVYDPITRHCTVARAGHPAPVVMRPDGAVEVPEVRAGPPLGLGGLPFESTELDLPDGSMIALFTDGLIGAGRRDRVPEAGLAAGAARLAAAIADGPSGSLDDMCDHVMRTLLPDTPADDDVALLLAHANGLDASRVSTWDLPPDPAMVAHARRLTTEQLAAWGLEEMAFVTELVVSELVTNAIRYARAPIQLRLINDTSLICEVSDASSTAPHLRRARVYDEGGRGLLLVAQLTERWGTRHTLRGKTIWTEQPLPPPA